MSNSNNLPALSDPITEIANRHNIEWDGWMVDKDIMYIGLFLDSHFDDDVVEIFLTKTEGSIEKTFVAHNVNYNIDSELDNAEPINKIDLYLKVMTATKEILDSQDVTDLFIKESKIRNLQK
ncbi:hypothetical protein [Photobacterium kishitanii]|uniref:Uncharacterized protein n=1 Tax=Photobacterium kishitanii TaxID=318456 RepID=A0A2T3KKX0_9GAMM|nr:hypothetical protein [Photobacterium kishitanii]PSV00341.1 hypothetical protein C9J27_04235 [Photobacterium kishitanii]